MSEVALTENEKLIYELFKSMKPTPVEPVKRSRGRPKKKSEAADVPKRGIGRPTKYETEEERRLAKLYQDRENMRKHRANKKLDIDKVDIINMECEDNETDYVIEDKELDGVNVQYNGEDVKLSAYERYRHNIIANSRNRYKDLTDKSKKFKDLVSIMTVYNIDLFKIVRQLDLQESKNIDITC
jgi:hypothetical protein